MAELNLTNSGGRDARVAAGYAGRRLRVRWMDDAGRPVAPRRILRATKDHELDALLEKHGSLEQVGDAILSGDPEVDIETFGSVLRNTARVFINDKGEIVRHIERYEVLLNPDGSEKERRPMKATEANIATEIPVKWTGKHLKKKDVYNKFVFSGMMQIFHVNGLTFDFLYEMAKELHEKDSMMLIGAGPKGNQPLIFRRGGTPYRGFLEGRIEGNKYALLLHLSNMELKAPAKEEEAQ